MVSCLGRGMRVLHPHGGVWTSRGSPERERKAIPIPPASQTSSGDSHSPGPPSRHPVCRQPAPAGGHMPAAVPGIPASAGRSAGLPPPCWGPGQKRQTDGQFGDRWVGKDSGTMEGGDRGMGKDRGAMGQDRRNTVAGYGDWAMPRSDNTIGSSSLPRKTWEPGAC